MITVTIPFDGVCEDVPKVKVDTSKIPEFRAKKIGKAFYNAYMKFIRDPQNEAMIEREAEKFKQKECETAAEAPV